MFPFGGIDTTSDIACIQVMVVLMSGDTVFDLIYAQFWKFKIDGRAVGNQSGESLIRR